MGVFNLATRWWATEIVAKIPETKSSSATEIWATPSKSSAEPEPRTGVLDYCYATATVHAVNKRRFEITSSASVKTETHNTYLPYLCFSRHSTIFFSRHSKVFSKHLSSSWHFFHSLLQPLLLSISWSQKLQSFIPNIFSSPVKLFKAHMPLVHFMT